MAQGLPRRNSEKNAVGLESTRMFLRISTQDHPSLADRKQVLNVAVRHTPAEVTLAVMFEFEHNSKLRRHRDIST